MPIRLRDWQICDWLHPGSSCHGCQSVVEATMRSSTSVSLYRIAMTFSCIISSLGYFTPDEAKLNIIIRAKGGAVLHTWSVGVLVKCTNKDQPLTPLIHEVPSDLAPNVFTNVNACGENVCGVRH
jgi:hypothetical protein